MVNNYDAKTDEQADEQKRKNMELNLQMQKENMKVLYHQIDDLSVIL